MPVPTILVNCTDSLRGWHLTHIEVQGFALISISKLKPRFPDNLRRSIFHETAHCFLRCGIPVLDEGFAYLFSEQFSGETRVEGVENAKHLSEGDKFSKLFAAGEESDAHRADLRYRQGQLLVLEIWNVIGATRLKALFQKIAADQAPFRAIRHIEDALGFPIDALCNNSPETWRLLTNAWHAIANETDIASLMLTLSKLEPIAMQLTDMHVLDAIISIRLKIIRLGLYGICEVQTSLIQEFLEDLPALIEETARSGLSPSRVWTLRGHLASILVKKYFPHLAKVSVELDKAYHCYETAFSFDASDPDLLIHFGLLKILTPESVGGDRADGARDIRSSLDHPLWGGLARRLLNNFGLAGDVWLPFSSESRQAVLSGVSK